MTAVAMLAEEALRHLDPHTALELFDLADPADKRLAAGGTRVSSRQSRGGHDRPGSAGQYSRVGLGSGGCRRGACSSLTGQLHA